MDTLSRQWHSDGKRKPKRKGFEVQEKLGAEAHPGGKQTVGSGCSQRPDRKGDSVGDYFRQSAKTTDKLSLKVERVWWEEIVSQAQSTGHQPMLVLGFDANPRHGRTDIAGFELTTAKLMTRALHAVLTGDYAEARALAELVMTRQS